MTMKWWRKPFIYLFIIILLNNYILHKKCVHKTLPLYEFRHQTTQYIISQALSTTISTPPECKITSNIEVRIDEKHFYLKFLTNIFQKKNMNM